jgi:hypothetical protein
MVLLIGMPGVILNIMAPFPEESWLEEKFGANFALIKQAFPGFFDPGKIDKELTWVVEKLIFLL